MRLLDIILSKIGFRDTTKLRKDIEEAAEGGNIEDLRKLLAKDGDKDSLYSWALRKAAENGHVECVKELIPHYIPRSMDSGALRDAAENGHLECVKELIPVSGPRAMDSSALRLAAEGGHIECVKLLIPYSDIDTAACILREDHFFDAAAMVETLAQADRLLTAHSPTTTCTKNRSTI